MSRLTTTLAAVALFAGAARGASAVTPYEPLNCERAASPAQSTVCRTYGLGQAEAHMATLYAVVMSLSAMGVRGDVGESQREWLNARERCGADVACLTRTYRARIEILQKTFEDIASRGPF